MSAPAPDDDAEKALRKLIATMEADGASMDALRPMLKGANPAIAQVNQATLHAAVARYALEWVRKFEAGAAENARAADVQAKSTNCIAIVALIIAILGTIPSWVTLFTQPSP